MALRLWGHDVLFSPSLFYFSYFSPAAQIHMFGKFLHPQQGSSWPVHLPAGSGLLRVQCHLAGLLQQAGMLNPHSSIILIQIENLPKYQQSTSRHIPAALKTFSQRDVPHPRSDPNHEGPSNFTKGSVLAIFLFV